MAARTTTDDPAMAKVREHWDKLQAAGWTQQRLGEAMGYGGESARKSVSQFLKSRDPQISMLRRFARATGVKLTVLVRSDDR